VTDHGRGTSNASWKSHGANIADSRFIWMGVLGPDTPALGERANVPTVTQNQVAPTAAALLGLDYKAEQPQAGPVLVDALPKVK